MQQAFGIEGLDAKFIAKQLVADGVLKEVYETVDYADWLEKSVAKPPEGKSAPAPAAKPDATVSVEVGAPAAKSSTAKAKSTEVEIVSLPEEKKAKAAAPKKAKASSKAPAASDSVVVEAQKCPSEISFTIG